jgi:hypothetical protein
MIPAAQAGLPVSDLPSMLAARFRVPYLAEPDGPGVPTLRSRLRA